MSTAVYTVGLVFGGLAVFSVCYVFMKTRTFGFGGGVLSLVGVILIGLSLWSRVKIEVSKEGLKGEFETLQQNVVALAGASESLSEEVKTLAERAETTSDQLVALTRNLEAGQSLNMPDGRNIRRQLDAAPSSNISRIDSAATVFKNVQTISRRPGGP